MDWPYFKHWLTKMSMVQTEKCQQLLHCHVPVPLTFFVPLTFYYNKKYDYDFVAIFGMCHIGLHTFWWYLSPFSVKQTEIQNCIKTPLSGDRVKDAKESCQYTPCLGSNAFAFLMHRLVRNEEMIKIFHETLGPERMTAEIQNSFVDFTNRSWCWHLWRWWGENSDQVYYVAVLFQANSLGLKMWFDFIHS